jgi:hypothetical protein
MELTTGAILRRITETPLSTAAHKLATIILDGIAWKDGFNGLERGTAAFTLAQLTEKMGVSRQHLTVLLVELAASGLALVRWKPNGKFAPWLFRFGRQEDAEAPPDVVSASDDTSLSKDSKNKTIFAGRIEICTGTNVYRTPWADLIKVAKTSLACWNVDTQAIWERFLAFNRARGNSSVPAGFLLGFMRKWRIEGNRSVQQQQGCGSPVSAGFARAVALSRPAPFHNRYFYQSELERQIGATAYERRISEMQMTLDVSRLAAMLAVHGEAVTSGEVNP